MKNIKLYLFFILILLNIINIFPFIKGDITVTTSEGHNYFNVSQNSNYVFNLSVNNSNYGQEANITDITIYLPESLSFIQDSQNTDITKAIYSNFTPPSAIFFTTDLSDFLMNGSENKHFWFSATANNIGIRNISIKVYNHSGSYVYDLSVNIEDTTPPEITLTSPQSTIYSINSMNFNITSNEKLNYCKYTLNNWQNNYTMTLASDNLSASSSNSSIGNSVYTFRYWCNDSYGNINNSASKIFTIDNTTIFVNLKYPQNITYNTNVNDLTYTVSQLTGSCWYSTDNGATNSTHVSAGINFSGLASIEDSSNTWTVYCNNSRGFTNSSKITFYKDAESSGSEAGSSSITVTGLTYTIDNNQLNEGYTIVFAVGDRIKFSFSGQDYYIILTSLNTPSISINITPNLKTANILISEEKKFDITNDNYYDISLKLRDISNNKANITIKKINELIPSSQTSSTPQTTTSSSQTNNQNETASNSNNANINIKKAFRMILISILILFGIIILIVSFVFIFSLFKKRNNNFITPQSDLNKKQNISPVSEQYYQPLPKDLDKPIDFLPTPTKILKPEFLINREQKPSQIMNNQIKQRPFQNINCPIHQTRPLMNFQTQRKPNINKNFQQNNNLAKSQTNQSVDHPSSNTSQPNQNTQNKYFTYKRP